MNFTLYIVGGKYPSFYKAAIKEYEKRLSRYCKLKTVILKNSEQLESKVAEGLYCIGIHPSGELISSEGLADKISTYATQGNSSIALILGQEGQHETLALSKMEMEAGLSHTVLLEQIYRAYRILGNEPYHK